MFYKLNCKLDPEKFLAYEEENRKFWFLDYGFDTLPMPPRVMEGHPLMNVIRRFRGMPVLLRMPPWTFYNFHVDTKRYCAINSLIAGYDSNAYFGSEVYKNEKLVYELEKIEPLDYQPESCYVFNTKHRHGVVNRAETRLTLSIGFNYNSYEEVLAYCQQVDL